MGEGLVFEGFDREQAHDQPDQPTTPEDSIDKQGYAYELEELCTPASSEDEGHSKPSFSQFSANAEFGQVHIENGMEFETLMQFKTVVRDLSI